VDVNLVSAAALFGICLAAALVALVLVSALDRRRAASGFLRDEAAGTVLLFDGPTLVDATDKARALLASSLRRGTAWERLLAYAAPRFPDLEAALAGLEATGRVALRSVGPDAVTLVAEWRGGLSRISLLAPHMTDTSALVDPLVQSAQEAELRELRETTDLAPFPIWRIGPTGAISWANEAYMALAARTPRGMEAAPWPPVPLFDDGPDGRPRAIVTADGTRRWFTAERLAAGPEVIGYALPADAAMQAEAALAEFLQTLARTFAHLSTGLAIFDAQRRLQMFNPALTDLTTLPVEFLSGRPTLSAMLDAMRARRMIPEPKDYKSWRQRIAALEAAGDAGAFEEVWSLSQAMTYRVVIRPHPAGGLALLIEDISESVSMTRNHRADLALSTAVIDALDEAIAVFSAEGALLMANAAYRALFGGEGEAPARLEQALGQWEAATAPDPIWAELATMARSEHLRTARAGSARLPDGRLLAVRFQPMPAGGSLFAFATPPAAERREGVFGPAPSRRSA
jgi:PAS domain-containing protein